MRAPTFVSHPLHARARAGFTDDDRRTIKVISSLSALVLRGWRTAELQRLREKQFEAQRSLCFTIAGLNTLPAI
eukprot:6345207-Prymnesium_polylepis.1